MQAAKAEEFACQMRRELAEQFAISARLYAEAVVMLTRPSVAPRRGYEDLRAAAVDAQRRAEGAAAAFEEHVETHNCQSAGM